MGGAAKDPIPTMAEVGDAVDSNSKSFSMRMVIYGVGKKFPSVRHVSCEQLEEWRRDSPDKLVILVRFTSSIDMVRVSQVRLIPLLDINRTLDQWKSIS